MLDLEDTGLQLSLFSSDTQKTTESNGNESDAESFATASSFTGPAIAADHQETGTGGIDVQAGTSGSVCSQSRCRRIRFQDARVEGDVGVVYGTPRSLDNNNLPAITPSESEGRQLQEKADFSSPGHEAITAGGPMEERHTSGLGPMMAKIKSDALQHSSGDSPASLEGGHGPDSNKTEVENEKVKSMDAAGVDAEMPQVQEGAVRTSWFCHPLTDAVAKIARRTAALWPERGPTHCYH
ncbi:hypothetical protein BGX23_000593 [Mortierella sp. AD031]|nr:hypothetical protein BGX23_000593 [Mortierella sp. AD031]